MAWAKIDDGWWCHPKVMGLSLASRGLWSSALSWSCHQRKDTVPQQFLAMVGATFEDAKELVAAGLWVDDPGGYRIHDWCEYQERSTSEKRAEAGRKGGLASGESRAKEANHEAPSKQTPSKPKQTDEANDEAGALPGPSRPSPTELQEPSSVDPLQHLVDREFEAQFWPAYPERRGKKLGKGAALVEWRKLTAAQRERALIGARNLAASDQMPKDAERFLRSGKGDAYPFDDWQEPAKPAGKGPVRPPEGEVDYTAGWGAS
jgi:hypothetical protein